jgi:hypothetical protein
MLNSKKALKALEYAFPRRGLVYLPNIYPRLQQTHVGSVESRVVHVGCFGAIRPMKNQLLQAMAAIKYAQYVGKDLRFHINNARVETQGAPVLKNLRALLGSRLVEHGWLDRQDFLRLIGRLDIGLQVSLTETFNIVAADMVGVGLPVVVSDEIEWVARDNQAEETSVESIVNTMVNVSRHCTKRWSLIAMNRYNLKQFSEHSLELWNDFLR